MPIATIFPSRFRPGRRIRIIRYIQPRDFTELYSMCKDQSPSAGAIRLGGVTYLNARPLIDAVEELDPRVRLTLDHPSRLADGLLAGRFDAATVPSIVLARRPECAIVSDACIACHGPVRSVKLFGRVPAGRILRLALDEGSRTSAALAQILLAERHGVRPKIEPLPIEAALGECSADAMLLIGDRGMTMGNNGFEFVWDLGAEWKDWTGEPFVFALWIARPDCQIAGLGELLSSARDRGVGRLAEIARRQAPQVGLPESECLAYLRDNLTFHFGPSQRRGMERFFSLARKHGLV
jgi:chorismate dehydratase